MKTCIKQALQWLKDTLTQDHAPVLSKLTKVLADPVHGAAARAGFSQVLTVLEGFEGDRDDTRHRGGANGRRFHERPRTRD